MRTIRILGLGAAAAIGAGLGCAALIGLDPADPQPACTNTADLAAMGAHEVTFVGDLVGCTLSNPGDPGAATACIQAKDRVSTACAGCAAESGACGGQSCAEACSGGASSGPCEACIASQCSPAFVACAGFPIYACVDAPDTMALAKHAASTTDDLHMCEAAHAADQSAVVACIEEADEITPACATCFAQEGLCALTECSMCVDDPTSAGCMSCFNSTCLPVFTLCSGIQDDGGT